ncbi:MAG: ComF family protein [Bacteroidota bacterium]|nr:ComF family protein [Bacteroidota bacterium]
MQAVKTILSDFTYLVFPDCCSGCEEPLVSGEELICTKCRTMLPISTSIYERENSLWRKFRNRADFYQVFALLKYTKSGIVQHLMQSFKYKKEKEIGELLGKIMAEELSKTSFIKPDVIVPVPIHPKKLKIRGYNQAAVFGESLSKSLEIGFEEKGLNKITFSKSQTIFKRKERWNNTEGIFELSNGNLFENKHIAIADDIITTGATVESLALEIQKANPKSISVLAIAEAVN